MSNTDGKEETMQEGQQDLFRELSLEQKEAEKDLQEQKQAEEAEPQDESDE